MSAGRLVLFGDVSHGSLISKCKRPKCVGMHFGLVISNLAIQSLVYKGQSKYLVKSTDRAGFTTREDDAGPTLYRAAVR